MASKWVTAWVTGGSTGIGRDVVIRLASEGVRVAASARSLSKLQELSEKSKNILPVPVDVSDRAQVAAAFATIVAANGPVDLAILSAGVWEPMGARDYDAGRANHSMQVNYGGIVNVLDVLLPAMRARGSGHIALVASVAGYRGLPQAAAYAPTKAAIINLAEVLRPDLARDGITISVVNPGFVDTPMTATNKFPMPFKISSDAAAERILSGLARGKFEIAFPWQLVGILKVMRCLPYPLYFQLARLFLPRE